MNLNNNRVLCRRGARELTFPETAFVVGAGAFRTLVCTAPISAAMKTATVTGPGDGDGCSDSDTDS